jgi:uncharacterized protein YndB with AHSA1/START domain
MSNTESSVHMTEREVEITREFDAPVQRVWRAWSDPEHIAQWFGPAGFRTVTQSREFRSGGHWHFTMIGPDGHEYLNRVDYLEIVPHALLRYRQVGAGDTAHINFETAVRFEPCGAGNERTRLVMHSVFPSAEALRHVVENYGAIEGGKQTQARLAEFLAAQAGGHGAAARPFVLTRHFKAPRELVWRAWTEVEQLAQWMSPAGCTTISARLDLRAGGQYHYGLRTPDGNEMWGMWLFRELVAPARLVTVNSFSDAAGGLTRHPMAPDWPRYTLSTLELLEHAGLGRGTTLQLRWEPYEATAAEIAIFNAAHAGMEQGWSGTMAQLEAWLAGQG